MGFCQDLLGLPDPHQLAPFRPATPAKPALGLVRLAIAVEILAALSAPSLPSSSGHFRLAAAHGSGANLQAPACPYLVVAMPWTYQGVGNFVQDGVQDLFLRVAHDKVNGKLDGAATIDAQAQGAFATIESEIPVMQAVLGQQTMGKGPNLLNPVGEVVGWFWTDRPGDWLGSSSSRGGLFRFCVLAEADQVFQITDGGLE
jgi:hypothetical protein